jgi:hypothetical protein
VEPTSGVGSLISFAATANNVTNDPATLNSTQKADGYANSPSSYLLLPEAIWAAASGGGTWVTGVQIIDKYGGTPVGVIFNYGGGNYRGPFTLWTGGAANSSITFDNILSAIDNVDTGTFDYFGRVGAVEFLAMTPGGRIQVSARTSNGNYSKSLQGLRDVTANTANTSRQMMIQKLESNGTYRAAAGFFNPSSSSLTVEFSIINSSGALIGSSFNKNFVGHDYQTFNPFAEAGIPYPGNSYDNVYLLISPTTGSGRIFCFGSTSNNTTNDPASHTAVQHD